MEFLSYMIATEPQIRQALTASHLLASTRTVVSCCSQCSLPCGIYQQAISNGHGLAEGAWFIPIV
jgi:hypothetical protein